MSRDGYWAMFSPEGNAAVDEVFQQLRSFATTPCSHGRLPSRREVLRKLNDGLEAVRQQHPEVYDTAVRECTFDACNRLLNEAGHAPMDSFWDW